MISGAVESQEYFEETLRCRLRFKLPLGWPPSGINNLTCIRQTVARYL